MSGAGTPATTAPLFSPIPDLYTGLRLQVLGVSTGIALTAAGSGIAFQVPRSQNALLVMCILDGFTAARVDSAIIFSFGYTATAYGDLYSAALSAAVGGTVTALTIAAGGTGYTVAPTLTIVSNDAGSGATATATSDGDAVDSATITNPGHGYGSPPTVTILGTGTGARITTTVGTGFVAPKPIIILQNPKTARIAGGVSVFWAVSNQSGGSGTCNATWLGGFV